MELRSSACRRWRKNMLMIWRQSMLAPRKSCAWRPRSSSAREAYREAAGALSTAREGGARALEKAVMAELPPLKLERAEFSVDLTIDDALVSCDRL